MRLTNLHIFNAVSLVFLISLLTIFNPTQLHAAKNQSNFLKWKAELWLLAKEKGISKNTFEKAFKNLRPNYKLPRVRTHKQWQKIQNRQKQKIQKTEAPKNKQTLPASCLRPRQKEFLFPTLYFPKKQIQTLVRQGKAIKQKHTAIFLEIEKQFGVDINVILAIWGRETAYGKAKNKFHGIQTWASLAFAGPPHKRKKAKRELLAALKFIDQGHISLQNFKTSFAGATGYPQFTPLVFDKHAVDFDKDGRKNIWTSIPDTIASIANHLKHIGWQSNQRWGYEVKLPKGFNCAYERPKNRRTIQEWMKLGVQITDRNFKTQKDKTNQDLIAQFVAPAGTLGPTFLVLENFEVFRRYNKADLYALFIGNLADRLSCPGNYNLCSFNRPWPKKDSFNFSRRRICEMQIHLKRLGASEEIPDGLFGGKTRNGIGTYEKSKKLSTTCFPNKKLLKLLRQDK